MKACVSKMVIALLRAPGPADTPLPDHPRPVCRPETPCRGTRRARALSALLPAPAENPAHLARLGSCTLQVRVGAAIATSYVL